ncbi:efflux RND transporter periplasmic adaptor subunit [Geminicoccaceae bacterium 1502E]|nr:efflux RND transporter periplasmic adaptor subunit [Geminicoccaceae bacterium 1502E]
MPYRIARGVAGLLVGALALCAPSGPADAQAAPAGPPAVGVVEARRTAVTESHGFIGRVEAIDRVEAIARVDAFLEERLFQEGAEVGKGDLLYRLERGPYEAAVAAEEAAAAAARAELTNAGIELERARNLMRSTAGTQARVDDALARERTAAARLQAAQAQLRTAQINLGYTEIRAPVSGRIGRTRVTVGNVVGPNSGPLATIVSQDPIYVTFPVPVRTVLDLRTRHAAEGGLESMLIRLRLPDGRIYRHAGELDFIDIEVGRDTDTISLRGTVPNPLLPPEEGGNGRIRELAEGELVTVMLEAARPEEQLTIPRESVASSQGGDFVYVVGAGDVVERRKVRLGETSPTTAVVLGGLEEGERVVLEGIQRVQPGMKVAPAPAETDAMDVSALAAGAGAAP